MISFSKSLMLERNIQNSPKLLQSRTDKLIFGNGFPKMKLYCSKTSSLIISSKRIIKGYMLANKLQPHSIEIKNEITKPVRAARSRYAVSLEEEMKKNESLKTEGAKENCLHRN